MIKNKRFLINKEVKLTYSGLEKLGFFDNPDYEEEVKKLVEKEGVKKNEK